jgi:hypothetical protein
MGKQLFEQSGRAIAIKKHAITSLKWFCLLLCYAGCQKQPQSAPATWQDDFSNPRSGWQRSEDLDTNSYLGYQDQRYLIQAGDRRALLWGLNQAYTFKSSQIAVTAYLDASNPEAGFGVLCGYQDASHFYFFELGADGYYAIVHMQAGEPHFLAGDSKSTQLPNQAASYRLQVICTPQILQMQVGTLTLASVIPPSAPDGLIGLLVHTYQRGAARVYFDDLQVVQQP